jgi:hypothetical protein
MNHFVVVNTMAINLFKSNWVEQNKWRMLAPDKNRGQIISIGSMNYRDEYFLNLSQAVHRAFRMKEKAKGFKDIPVIVYMGELPTISNNRMTLGSIDPELVFQLEKEEDAIFLILKYDQS